ncbi:hypothetical protein D3C87_1039070 [compost metagenome]
MDGDHQLRGVGQPVGVGDPVGEEFCQGLPRGQCLDGSIGAVDIVEERTVGADAQRAVQTDHQRAVG